MAPTLASAPMAGTNGVRPVAARKPSNQTSAVRSRGMSHASIARPSAASSSSAVKVPPAPSTPTPQPAPSGPVSPRRSARSRT
eukprot:2376058-Prymnesium_polylepis.1